MELKTYTRARAAKAAAAKATAGLEAFVEDILTKEAKDQPGRYFARVIVKAAAGREIEDAIIAKGFAVGLGVKPATEEPKEEPKAEEPKAKAAPKQAPAVRHKSLVDSPCAMVWAIADDIAEEGGSRKDILEACREAGIATATARTQYDRWRINRKNKG